MHLQKLLILFILILVIISPIYSWQDRLLPVLFGEIFFISYVNMKYLFSYYVQQRIDIVQFNIYTGLLFGATLYIYAIRPESIGIKQYVYNEITFNFSHTEAF